jgi:hypothetical protein
MSDFMPPWWHRYGPRSQSAVPSQQMRVSDAERTQVADDLAKHYAEGRLDETEFNDRLQKAMSSKTRADLGGLLSDLPVTVSAPASPARGRRSGRFVLLALFTFFVAAAVTSAMWDWTWRFPWFLVVILFFVCWRRARWGWGWHAHTHQRNDWR